MSDLCVRELEKFDTAYGTYEPRLAFAGTASPSADARYLVRAAVQAVLKARPGGALELGRKVKIACVIGIHARIRRACPRPDPIAASLYDYLWTELSPIEPWYLAQASGYHYSFVECEFGPRGGNFIADPSFIRELLRSAGPAWEAAIEADVTRLNAVSRGDAE